MRHIEMLGKAANNAKIIYTIVHPSFFFYFFILDYNLKFWQVFIDKKRAKIGTQLSPQGFPLHLSLCFDGNYGISWSNPHMAKTHSSNTRSGPKLCPAKDRAQTLVRWEAFIYLGKLNKDGAPVNLEKHLDSYTIRTLESHSKVPIQKAV